MRGIWIKNAIIAGNIAVMFAFLLASAVIPTGPFVAVVVSPWSQREEALSVVANAGGTLVAPARVNWIVIAHSAEEGFVSRLRQSGALIVLNHTVMSGCFRG